MEIIKKHRFGLISALIFILFYKLIPVSIYNISPVIFSFIGGIVLSFFLVIYFFKYSTIKEFVEIISGRKKDSKRSFIGESFFIAISLIVFGLFFTLNQSENEERELVKNGVVEKAVVIEKSTISVTRKFRKQTVYYLTLSFTDNKETKREVKEDVIQSVFQTTRKGDIVRIIYSKENPNIVEIK